MDKVYIVVESDWDTYDIFGVYTTREAAEALVAKLKATERFQPHRGRSLSIDEFPLNTELSNGDPAHLP